MTHQLDHESLARLIQVLLRPNTIDTSILQATVRDKNLQFAERALRALGKCRSTAIEDQVMSAVDALVVECTRSADVAGLQLIVKYFDSLNAVDRSGRTALYLAALQGSVAVVRCLLNTSSDDRPLALDKPDGIHGRTPLMACCIRGHAEIAEMLLRAGADPKVQDRLGWTAREHAAYRGRLFLAASLPNISNTSPVMGPVRRTSSGPSHKLRSVADQGKSVLLVTPGPADTRSSAKCLDLVSPDLASQTLSIEFLPLNVDYDPATLQLPLLEDRINDPWIVEYVEDVRLQFKLYGLSTATSTSVLLGSGVALLSQPQTESPDERQPLRRDITFPIQGVKSMTAIATMTINVLNVKPYRSACRTVRPRSDHGFWKYPQRRTTVIGHRGSGANTTAHTNIQLGENTLNSFEAATTLGATGIEFDVQLTKDLVPVIYHNFLVMETGGEMTVWNLSQTQFTHISEAQGSKGSVSSMAEARYHQRNGQLPIKPRSRSADMYEDDRVSDLVSRMMHTTEAKSKGIKGNIRGHVVQDVFPKFKDLLTKLPEDVAFDVEMSK